MAIFFLNRNKYFNKFFNIINVYWFLNYAYKNSSVIYFLFWSIWLLQSRCALLIIISRATRKAYDASSRKIGTLSWQKCEIGQPTLTLVPTCFVRQKIANGFRSSDLERAESAVLPQETLLPSLEKKEKGGERRGIMSFPVVHPPIVRPLYLPARSALSRNAPLFAKSVS